MDHCPAEGPQAPSADPGEEPAQMISNTSPQPPIKNLHHTDNPEDYFDLLHPETHRVFDEEGGGTYRFSEDDVGQIPIVCCTCGLAHVVTVQRENGKISVTFNGHDELTKQARDIAGVSPVDSQVSDALAASLGIK